MSKRLDPTAELIRQNLVKFREEAGLSQAQASVDSGVPIDNLRRYESGRAGVSATVVKQLADAYGHKVDHFYMPDPPPADLESRPTFMLRTRGDEDLPQEVYEELLKHVEEANRKAAELRQKKGKTKK